MLGGRENIFLFSSSAEVKTHFKSVTCHSTMKYLQYECILGDSFHNILSVADRKKG